MGKGELVLLDQTKLPGNISYIYCRESREVGEAISRLSVRGAPAIGVAAAYGMVLAFKEIKKEGLSGPSLRMHSTGRPGSLLLLVLRQ